MNRRACLVCGGEYRASPRLPGMVECHDCQFVSADMMLSREDIERLYSADYFCGNEYQDYVADRRVIEKSFRVRLAKLLPLVGDPASQRLLEIGSAYGFFLSVAREHFLSVEGVEISREAAAYAREQLGVKVLTGDFLDCRLEYPVDIVCLWDTIEHLQNPDLYVEKAAASLRPGGLIALTTGDIRSWMARWRGARWRQIHPPTHLHYFSKDTLSRLLGKCGFEVRYCAYDGMFRSVAMIAYIILVIRGRQPGLYRALEQSRLLNWSFYSNLYDILFVVASRKS